MMPRVAIVGAGGLGGPVAYALAHAGLRLRICDDDRVELSNLQRQIQYRTADIGRLKVEALADELARRPRRVAGPGERAEPGTATPGGKTKPSAATPGDLHDTRESEVEAVAGRFTADSARWLMQDVDVIVDGSDSFATKFEVNDQAMALGMPFVIGSVARYGGQLLAVDPRGPRGLRGDGDAPRGCYRCLFEDAPAADEAPTCADAGVLGAATALIGGLMARAVLALVRGVDPLGGALWVIDDLRAPVIRQIHYASRPACPACARALSSPSRKE